MIKNITTIAIFALSLIAAPMLIQAEESAAIEIDADQSNCGTDLEDCTLEGNVVIKQGDSNITADKLYSLNENEWELDGNVNIEKTGMRISAVKAKVVLVERQLRKVVLTGSPVNFNYLVGSESRASGNANNVSFDLNQRMISLDGNAN